MALFVAQLSLLLQRVIPKRAITATMYHLARIRTRFIKDLLIRGFVKLYRVDLKDVAKSVPGEFASLNDFFTRELKDGSRPIDAAESAIVAPADGIISAIGNIDRNMIFQAKGREYSLEDLLATDLDEARRYDDGSFATIYLAPDNYHRVHAPLAGDLVAVRYVPGALFSVNRTTVSSLHDLFARNERLICHFNSDAFPFVVMFVGALNVGSITTPWTGEIRPRKGSVVDNIDVATTRQEESVQKGDLLGWFNMGSTVILLLPPECCDWESELSTGDSVRMGQAMGWVRRSGQKP